MRASSLGERLQCSAVRLVAHLPDCVKIALSGEPPIVIDGQRLDPQAQFLRAARRRRVKCGLIEPTIEAGRRRYLAQATIFRGPITPIGRVKEFEIPGPARPIRLRHYIPAAAASGPAPLLVYFHGGGFVIGDLDTHDEPCRILCREAGTHVLSVAYRLAPEHPFPAAVDDAHAAFRWAVAHAGQLGADPLRVGVGGDSAGGNLSAVVSALERGDRHPAAQLLIYPATDASTTRESHKTFDREFVLGWRDCKAFFRCYAGSASVDLADPRISPMRTPDLSGLPPALVVVAGFDVLRDEGEAYAAALVEAGTPARVERFLSLEHGFIHTTGTCPAARDAVVRIAEAWRTLTAAASPASPKGVVGPGVGGGGDDRCLRRSGGRRGFALHSCLSSMEAIAMAVSGRMTSALLAAVTALALTGARAYTQGEVMDPASKPLPNPNPKVIKNWGTLPDGRVWGNTAGVDIGPDGHVWAYDRCGSNSCAGSTVDPILKFDRNSGKLLASFGRGMFIFPHGLHVDRQGNVWVTDGRAASQEELAKFPNEKGKGHQVIKFSPDGKVLMRLGHAGMAGTAPEMFNEPNDVITTANGDIFVADGHSGQNPKAPPDTNARIVKLTRDGKFVKHWGKLGSGPGEFRTPHALAMDSRGRLFVADRGNHRIQIFDQEGKFLEEWKQFSRISGLFITPNDMLYAIDSESSPERHPNWKTGIRVGTTKEDKVLQFIPPHDTGQPHGAAGEGVAVDRDGNVYGAEGPISRKVAGGGLTKYMK